MKQVSLGASESEGGRAQVPLSQSPDWRCPCRGPNPACRPRLLTPYSAGEGLALTGCWGEGSVRPQGTEGLSQKTCGCHTSPSSPSK